VVFNRSWLSRPITDSRPELLQLLQHEVNKLEVQHGANFLDQVRSLLRATLVTGHRSAEQTAALFSMNRRTLNRHLNVLGTNYRKVVDEISFEIACQLLEDSAMDIVEIALILGYSNESAFTRAFRRWSLTTPAKWRRMATNGTGHIP